MSTTDLLISSAAIIPMQLDMPVGRWLRGNVPPAMFRVTVLLALVWDGIDLLHRALG
jgi:hypothetical protein